MAGLVDDERPAALPDEGLLLLDLLADYISCGLIGLERELIGNRVFLLLNLFLDYLLGALSSGGVLVEQSRFELGLHVVEEGELPPEVLVFVKIIRVYRDFQELLVDVGRVVDVDRQWAGDLFGLISFPVNVSQPGVLLELFEGMDPFHFVLVQEFAEQVLQIVREVSRQLQFILQNVFHHLVRVTRIVGWQPAHELVQQCSQRVVVHSVAVSVPLNDFWGHVPDGVGQQHDKL